MKGILNDPTPWGALAIGCLIWSRWEVWTNGYTAEAVYRLVLTMMFVQVAIYFATVNRGRGHGDRV